MCTVSGSDVDDVSLSSVVCAQPRLQCPGFRIQSGAGGLGGAEGDTPRFASPSELHEVTCCSNTGLPGFRPPFNNCPVWAERDGESYRVSMLVYCSYVTQFPGYAHCICSIFTHLGTRMCVVLHVVAGGALTCLGNVNWTYANAFCQQNGARLCNNTELILGCGATLGCGFNANVRRILVFIVLL